MSLIDKFENIFSYTKDLINCEDKENDYLECSKEDYHKMNLFKECITNTYTKDIKNSQSSDN